MPVVALLEWPPGCADRRRCGSRAWLLDRHTELIRARGDRLAEAVGVIAHAGDGGVVFHCSAGKDRTGVVAALERRC